MSQFMQRGWTYIIGLMIVAGSLTGAKVALAADNVIILPTVYSRCGEQFTYATGAASYANVETGRLLMVFLDGRLVYQNPDRPTAWSTNLFFVTPGQHIITAGIYRLMSGSSQQLLLTSASDVITVPSCSTSSSGGGGGGGNGGGGGGGGESEPAPKIGKVLGTTTAACSARTKDSKVKDFIANKSTPIVVARLFREVFQKDIKPSESNYWKGRARCDKATEAKLKGAMQFQKSKGKTMPIPVKAAKKR